MLHHSLTGPPGAPVLLLSSGLGGSGSYWAEHLEALGSAFRVITYDQRGTGRSAATLERPTSIAAMAEDAARLLDHLGVQECGVIGHALGGLIGLALAAACPGLVSRLVVVNGWLAAHDHTRRCFDVRRDLLLGSGAASYVRAQPLFLYPSWWMAAQAERLARDEAHALAQFPSTGNVLARIEALLAFDGRLLARQLACRTLAIVSHDDLLVPPVCSETLHASLRGSRLARLDGGHACNVTRPRDFERLCLEFLDEAA